jgi:hypothetical protein
MAGEGWTTDADRADQSRVRKKAQGASGLAQHGRPAAPSRRSSRQPPASRSAAGSGQRGGAARGRIDGSWSTKGL